MKDPSGDSGIPTNVRKWFRISLILNSIMFVPFIAAFIRNYLTANLPSRDYSLPLFLFLSPVLMRVTYLTTKNHIETNSDKLPTFGGFDFIGGYDDFLISVIKLFIILTFARLIVEFLGQSGWSSLLEYFSSPVRQLVDLILRG